MATISFESAVEQLTHTDPRFPADAYFFLKEALDFTVRRLKKKSVSRPAGGHVSAGELLEGIRLYGLQQFGPMTMSVFEHWNITQSAHFGEIVFSLIRVGLFGKTDEDSQEDFKCGLDFHDAFVKPYEPARPLSGPHSATSANKRLPTCLPGMSRKAGTPSTQHSA